ncbi:MAG: WG repeat-containing protein, partial [Bacteroidota bacterium]|nr:WG repeat-containing protein [Bacteroidota bacterium]MDX5429859.1 WG repeat-containing protein [Bacteroidota bacterium]MDX5468638.1 WG repeat-containing protein [Bacteroidota bacterium]
MRGLCLVVMLFSLGAKAQVLISAKSNGKYGLLDTAGRWHLNASYDSLGAFFHQSVPYCVRGKWGLLHANGSMISPAAWAEISYEEEGKVAVFDGHYWGYINLQGKTIIEPQFLEADDF